MIAATALMAWAAPAASASFGVSSFEAGTCKVSSCTYASIEADHGEAFTQAAGHPQWGITTFELNHKAGSLGLGEEPEGALKRVRVDVPPGLAADPQALPQCSEADFQADHCPAETQVGTNELEVYEMGARLPLTGQVYDLVQRPGLPLLFGIHVEVKGLANEHIYLEGHADWEGDYHEYFEINNISKAVPVLKSKLNFNGRAGQGNFLTLPSECSSTSYSELEAESWEGQIAHLQTHTPVGVENCGAVPFQPEVTVTPETPGSDQADGALITVRVPQNVSAESINTADIRDLHLLLPEGMTMNPPAARGLDVCTASQAAAGACPAASQVGTIDIETDLPAHSLTGAMYLGSPGGGTITGPPYTLYLDATTAYGVSVRLHGQVVPNEQTGRLETTFLGNPQLPFSELLFKVNGGGGAPIANPLACGTAQTETIFTPYTDTAAWTSRTPFATSTSGGGPCPSPLPFVLSQSTQDAPATAGAPTSYTFDLARPEGNQYLSRLRTVLPAGVVGLIPSLTPCPEPQAQAGSCPASSEIGKATAAVGSGSEPLSLSGPVYLTGPYGGAPYGLSVPIEAATGHFDLGRVVTRATVGVDPYSGRVIVESALPTIFRGIPLRLRSLSVVTNRPGFMLNPTSCGPLATESTLTSTWGATALASSPFQVSGCSALRFGPVFAAATNVRQASRANGIGLRVNVLQAAHEADIRSVVTQLPAQLPSRLTTLQKACLATTWAANPRSCPAESLVGTATVSTPVLPTPLSGPAYLVAQGGAQFPNLDILLEGDNGVRVILVGTTAIHNGITTSSFASLPDVPMSSFVLELPAGPHSALTSYGSLCKKPLIMPVTMTAQSGAQLHEDVQIGTEGCRGYGPLARNVQVLRIRRHGRFLRVTVRTLVPGRLSVSGHGLRSAHRRLARAKTVTFRLLIGHRTYGALRSRRRRLHLHLKLAFVPAATGEPRVSLTATFPRPVEHKARKQTRKKAGSRGR